MELYIAGRNDADNGSFKISCHKMRTRKTEKT